MRRSGEAIRTSSSWLGRVTGIEDARAARSAARTWRRGGLGLIILCLLVYIPGLWTIPPVDRDESRFAQASRQMLESGTLEGWVVPHVQDKPRLNKPPLIYWLQASSAATLGDRPGQWAWLDGGSENIWVYRLPSVLSAMAAVLLTWRLGLRMFDPRAAWLAGALLAVCPMVVWDAHQARADQLLLATTTATMLALWHVWSRTRLPAPPPPPAGEVSSESASLTEGGRNATASATSPLPHARKASRATSPAGGAGGTGRFLWPTAFWLALSLGIMTKGPITPMIAALTCLALSLVARDWRWLLRLRPILGLVIVAAVVAPWVILVGNEVGWSKYLSIIYDETIGRSAGAKEGHWGPPGYHIVLLGLLFWPGSLLTAAAIGRAWKRGMRPTPPPAPPPPPAGEVAESARSEGARDAAGSPTPPLRHARIASRATSPTGGGGGAIRRLASTLRRLRPSRPAELFLLAWMLPAWLVFELISTKLPHYTMPLYPAVALISARALFGARAMFFPPLTATHREKLTAYLASNDAKCPSCKYNLRGLTATTCPECSSELRLTPKGRITIGYASDRSQFAGRLLWIIFGIAIGIGIPLALVLWNITTKDDFPVRWDTAFIVGGVLCITVCALLINRAVGLMRRSSLVTASLVALGINVVAFSSVFWVFLPRSSELWLSRSVMSTLKAHGWTPSIPLACSGYTEDSLIFLTRGRANRLAGPSNVERWLADHRHAVVIRGTSTLRLGVTLYEPPLRHWGEFEGFNYSTGERVLMKIYEVSQ